MIIKNTLLAVFSILLMNAYSQGRKSLDLDNGILKFKLMSNYNLYKNDLEYVWTDKSGIEFYDYVKNDIKTVYGRAISKINLAFYNNQLYNITFHFGILSSSEKFELMELLRKKYDYPELLNPNNHIKSIARWETGKVLMHLQEYDCSSQVFPCITEIFINSKILDKQIGN